MSGPRNEALGNTVRCRATPYGSAWRRGLRPCAAALALAVVASGCTGAARGEGRLTVLAAASLAEALPGVGAAFEQANPGVRLAFSFAGSQVLAAQVLEGAPADVLATADALQMERVADAGLVETPAVFATNRLVIAVPAANPAGIDEPADLARDGVRVVLAGPAVPAGRYARAALGALGLAEAVERNVVSAEPDVRAVLGKVVLGVADAAVVYRSDVSAALADRVRVVELPTDVAAAYHIAVITTAAEPRLARAFVAFVRGDGAALLHAAGLRPP